MTRFLPILLPALLLPACIVHRQTVSDSDGKRVTETTVLSPLSPVVPATLAVTPEGMRASTGARQGVDQALAGLTRSTAWLAALLVVAGVVSLVARFWLPFIPVNASVMLLASAAALYAFPILVDRYLPYVALGLAAVAGLWLWGWFDNRNKMRSPI